MNKQLLAFNVMSAVQASYAEAKVSDGEFAKRLTKNLGADVSTARVRQARLVLGITAHGKADLKALLQEILADEDTVLSEDLYSRLQEALK